MPGYLLDHHPQHRIAHVAISIRAGRRFIGKIPILPVVFLSLCEIIPYVIP
jgi:hypothetical protein